MFRATVLSLVLTLTAGQYGPVLCRVWCDPQEAARIGCHRGDMAASPTVGGNAYCITTVTTGVAAFVREDMRPGVAGADTPTGVGSYFQLHWSSGSRLLTERGEVGPFEPRQPVITLRI